MTFDFHPQALTEFRETAVWYEEQRLGLGLEFTEAVEKSIFAILESPGTRQPVGEGVRVFRLSRFPYSLFYHFAEHISHVRIVAVMHHKPRPDSWRGRS